MNDTFDTTSLSLGLTDPASLNLQSGTGIDLGSTYSASANAGSGAWSASPSVYNDSSVTPASGGSWWSNLTSGINSALPAISSLATSGASIYKTIDGASGGGSQLVAIPGKTQIVNGKVVPISQGGSNTTLYVILGVVALVLVGALFLMGRGKK